MNNVQFCHKRKYNFTQKLTGLEKKLCAKGGVTAALDLLDVEYNRPLMKIGDTISVKASVAICSDQDNYNKKIGRNIALGRLTARQFLVKQISDNYIILENSGIEFTIRISGENLRFVSVE